MRIDYRNLLRDIAFGTPGVMEYVKRLFVGKCPRCGREFGKKRVDQVYERDTCRKEHTRKK